MRCAELERDLPGLRLAARRDATHFTRAKRVAYAIVDFVTRYWIGYLLTTEQTSTQALLLFAQALEDQDLVDALTQHHGRPRPDRPSGARPRPGD